MTKEEFIIKGKELEKEFEQSKLRLAKEFAFSNNPFKVGDIIKDHVGVSKNRKHFL